jgi:hypothetical protein
MTVLVRYAGRGRAKPAKTEREVGDVLFSVGCYHLIHTVVRPNTTPGARC